MAHIHVLCKYVSFKKEEDFNMTNFLVRLGTQNPSKFLKLFEMRHILLLTLHVSVR